MDSTVDPEFYRSKGLAYTCLAEQAYKLAEQATISGNPKDEFTFSEEDTIRAKGANIEKHKETKQRRLQRGLRTPERAFYQPILQALVDLGGSSRFNELLPKLEEYMKHILKTVDYDPLPSHPGELRWENTARFARMSMVKDGRLKSDSPFGVWEVT